MQITCTFNVRNRPTGKVYDLGDGKVFISQQGRGVEDLGGRNPNDLPQLASPPTTDAMLSPGFGSFPRSSSPNTESAGPGMDRLRELQALNNVSSNAQFSQPDPTQARLSMPSVPTTSFHSDRHAWQSHQRDQVRQLERLQLLQLQQMQAQSSHLPSSRSDSLLHESSLLNVPNISSSSSRSVFPFENVPTMLPPTNVPQQSTFTNRSNHLGHRELELLAREQRSRQLQTADPPDVNFQYNNHSPLTQDTFNHIHNTRRAFPPQRHDILNAVDYPIPPTVPTQRNASDRLVYDLNIQDRLALNNNMNQSQYGSLNNSMNNSTFDSNGIQQSQLYRRML